MADLESPDTASPPPLDPETFDPPAAFSQTASRLEEAGFEAWAVGGCLRDALAVQLSGQAYVGSSDWDLATSARPEDVIALFRRTVPVGVAHGTVGVMSGETMTEVTTFRRDVETDGRHATVSFADEIEEDLERRDFTINAIAWRPSTDELKDPHGGADDLRSGRLRAVGTAGDRFREDYLRVLRGVRFAGRFDLDIEPDTLEAMEGAVGGLPGLSAERIQEELWKVLRDPIPSTALDWYARLGALDAWYPELAAPAAVREAWLSTLESVDAVRASRPRVRLARLLVATGEDAETRGDAAEALLSRLRFSNADRKHVRRLVELYLPFTGPLDSSAEQRRWLSAAGGAWRDAFRLHLADARSQRSEHGAGYVVAGWRQVHGELLEHPPLALSDLAIDGDDVLDLGLPAGPLVRLMLDELLEQVLEDPDRNDREALREEAARLIELGALDGVRSDFGEDQR